MEKRSNFLALCLLDALEDEEDKVIFKILNVYHADPSFVQQERGISPLHYACGMPNYKLAIEVTERFIQCARNVNVRTLDNMTPLHVAAIHGRVEIVKMLLQHGADWSVADDERKTAILYAIEECHFVVVKLIRDHIFEYKYQSKQNCGVVTLCKDSAVTRLQREQQTGCTPNRCRQDVYPIASCENEENKYTPNKLHYNYDVTSPYYINITHRRHKPQPKFPALDLEESNNRQQFELANKTTWQENQEEKSITTLEPINIFTLTEENLQEFSRDGCLAQSSRTSLITEWREKVQRSTKRPAILRQYNNIDEMIDSMMQSDEFNFENTILNRSKSKDMHVAIVESDDGGSDLSSPIGDTQYALLPEKISQPFKLAPENIESNPSSKLIESLGQARTAAPQSYEESDTTYQTVSEIKIQNNSELPVPDNVDFIHSPKCGEYILQMTEDYVHTDTENGLVFYERKLIRNRGNKMAEHRTPNNRSPNGFNRSVTTQSTNFTLPIDYDTDALRAELTNFGEPPGPITKSTKRLYIKRLVKYKRKTPEMLHLLNEKINKSNENKFSVELYRTVRSTTTFEQIPELMKYEAESAKFFANNKEKKDLREGHLKQSFIYLLIDPRISCNLPSESDFVDKYLVWRRFLKSIFYVGKAKTSRPYSHLYDAMKMHSRLQNNQLANNNANIEKLDKGKITLISSEVVKTKTGGSDSEKLKRILDIWNSGCGVVCLHVFHNIIPTDAYTREAAIIEALSLKHLTNLKRGNFYGPAKNWTMKEKKYLGIALLFKAMQIFLAEGESQLSPCDLI